MADEKPTYTKYRSRPKLFSKSSNGARAKIDDLRGGVPRPEDPNKKRLGDRFTFWRVLGYVAAAIAGWLLLSLLLFLISAQVERQGVAESAGGALKDSGYTLTSPNTILVLGSDARTKDSKEPGANKIGQPSRSDTIMLMRVGAGKSARLSIPRDTIVDIPGHGRDKINAAYAFGGPALTIQTIEQYLGIDIDHVFLVNFANFPSLIDAMGGIDYTGGCVVSRINGGFKNGGYTLRLRAGTTHIDGRAALALARTRENLCKKSDSDFNRSRRQQKILSAMKRRVFSPWGFVRLPLISWNVPKSVQTDMGGPRLLAYALGLAVNGNAPTRVLRATPDPSGGSGLTVSDADKQAAVQRFLR